VAASNRKNNIIQVFLAYRLTELGESDVFFGVGTSFAAVFAFFGTLIFGG
jgi:hypothetical protein